MARTSKLLKDLKVVYPQITDISFMTSNDYVIKCARERIQAWARNQNKEFELNNNNFVILLASI